MLQTIHEAKTTEYGNSRYDDYLCPTIAEAHKTIRKYMGGRKICLRCHASIIVAKDMNKYWDEMEYVEVSQRDAFSFVKNTMKNRENEGYIKVSVYDKLIFIG